MENAKELRGAAETLVGFQAGLPMATTLDSERILEAAVAGIPRVAMTIAEIPTAFRERAFAAAARSYQQTVRELGHTEADVQIWISAVMLRLRSHVAERRKTGLATRSTSKPS